MVWENPVRVEKAITQFTKEIEAIDAAIYPPGDTDRVLVAGTLERKRDDIVRSAVLQLHTAIEDLLTTLVHYCVLGIDDKRLKHRLKSERGKAFRKMLYGAGSLGFDMKLNFALGLGLIDKPTQQKLAELNTIRNKCSHNWLLKAVVRHGRRPRQQKPPLLLFRGSDLHKVSAIKQFISEFGLLYVRLYAKRVHRG